MNYVYVFLLVHLNLFFKFFTVNIFENTSKRQCRIKNFIYVYQLQQLATHSPIVDLSAHLCTFFFKMNYFNVIFRHYFTHIQHEVFYMTTIPLSYLTKLTITPNIL